MEQHVIPVDQPCVHCRFRGPGVVVVLNDWGIVDGDRDVVPRATHRFINGVRSYEAHCLDWRACDERYLRALGSRKVRRPHAAKRVEARTA